MIQDSITGGRTLVKTHYFESKDKIKTFNDIKDYLVMLDISGMYCYIMRTNKFPYGAAHYASNQNWINTTINTIIKNKKYDELLKVLPEFYIADVDCQPNTKDIEPSIGRHEDKRLHWDCKRRQSCYNSIDIQILLKNKGDLFETKKMLIWNKSEKVFEKWMNICLFTL